MKQIFSMVMAFCMVLNMTALCFARDTDYYIYVEEAESEPVEKLADVVTSEAAEGEVIEVVAVPAILAEDEETLDSGHDKDDGYYGGDVSIDWNRLNKIIDAHSVDREDFILMLDSAAERVVASTTQRNIMTTPLADYTVGEGLLAVVCILLVVVCVMVPFTRGRRF